MSTMLLLFRSFSQFVTAAIVYSDTVTRNDTIVATDVVYGLLTFLFFLTFLSVIRDVDKGKDKPEVIKSLIRGYVLEKLETETQQGYYKPRPFAEVLTQIEGDLPNILRRPPFPESAMRNDRETRRIAREEIGRMKRINFDRREATNGTPIYDNMS